MYSEILPPKSQVLISKAKIDQAINQLAQNINQDFKQKNVVFLTIMNGGMIFASALATRLNLNMEMDYLQLSRYGKNQSGGQLVWKYQPEVNMQHTHVILCDDIYDEGHTLAAAHAWCLEKGAISVSSVVLVHKDHDRTYANYKPDYIALNIPDHFIFGYGMDLEEKLRQLPEIYYIPPTQ
ncbi:hypoxanthine-guanine phosphoribosyltransferase [Marinicella sp. S1101]|uniref:hypoxanthine-guanine phosphoribosyltransferase n=1 Tax=Marinicella marina TaxID=2996016 RepID=UPI002260C760|nr:hypoxanthine-guanine phosphoribosyltransferase [Marinicella marina]MCX7553505.1 hypoxanthine-guanine phosphoribosyltransferase [Marinicella marina]MDJ1140129.1 hypoxanthine-guanine phosphoribosyltransferase [Marinicella marina]